MPLIFHSPTPTPKYTKGLGPRLRDYYLEYYQTKLETNLDEDFGSSHVGIRKGRCYTSVGHCPRQPRNPGRWHGTIVLAYDATCFS